MTGPTPISTCSWYSTRSPAGATTRQSRCCGGSGDFLLRLTLFPSMRPASPDLAGSPAWYGSPSEKEGSFMSEPADPLAQLVDRWLRRAEEDLPSLAPPLPRLCLAAYMPGPSNAQKRHSRQQP